MQHLLHKGSLGVQLIIAIRDNKSLHIRIDTTEGKVYFVLNATLKNLKKDKEDMDKLVSANLFYGDGYKYHCMLLRDNRGDLHGMYEYVDPLQTENVKFAVQLPKETQTNSKPVKVVFEMGTKNFEYIYR